MITRKVLLMKIIGGKNYLSFAIIIGSCLIICSCKVVHPYKQPVGVVSDSLYRNASVKDTNNIASISWKEMFSDTLLAALIQQGIDNNLRKFQAKQTCISSILRCQCKRNVSKSPIYAIWFPGSLPGRCYQQLGSGYLGQAFQCKKSSACIINGKRRL